MENSGAMTDIELVEPENGVLRPPMSPEDAAQVKGVLMQVLKRTTEHRDSRYVTAGKQVMECIDWRIPSGLRRQFKTLCGLYKLEQVYVVRFFIEMVVEHMQGPDSEVLELLLAIKKDAELRTLKAKRRRNKRAFEVDKSEIDNSAAA